MAVITTPKGKAVWPWIAAPDYKFNEAGTFSCRVHVTEDEFGAIKRQVDEQVEREYDEACKAAGKKIPRASSQPLRKTDDGDWEIYAKQNASRVTKDGEKLKFVIPVFDSQGKKLKTPPPVGSGSTIKMSIEPYTWNVASMGFGYTLRLKAVQVIDLVEYGGTVSFDAEEGGFVSEDLDDAMSDDGESVPF